MNFDVKAVGDDTLTFVGSDETVDRYQEVIKSDGWDFKAYKKNPVVMLFHNYASLPIAKATKVWVENKKLMFNIKFVPMDYGEIGSLADTVKKLYENKFMSGVSVGLIAHEVERAEPDNKKGIYQYITKAELLELSLVPIPANPSALITSRGIKDAMDAKAVDVGEMQHLQMALDEMIEAAQKEEDDAVLQILKDMCSTENIIPEVFCSDCNNLLTMSCDECDSDEIDCDCKECDDCKALLEPSTYDLLLEIRSEQTKEPSKEEDLITQRLISIFETPTE
jgi:HK97 family phage prohead protease